MYVFCCMYRVLKWHGFFYKKHLLFISSNFQILQPQWITKVRTAFSCRYSSSVLSEVYRTTRTLMYGEISSRHVGITHLTLIWWNLKLKNSNFVCFLLCSVSYFANAHLESPPPFSQVLLGTVWPNSVMCVTGTQFYCHVSDISHSTFRDASRIANKSLAYICIVNFL